MKLIRKNGQSIDVPDFIKLDMNQPYPDNLSDFIGSIFDEGFKQGGNAGIETGYNLKCNELTAGIVSTETF